MTVAVAAAVPASGSAHAATQGAWIDRGVRVVGGPVAANGRVLVLVSAPNRAVSLEAVDPANGAVRWSLPDGFSLITNGVAAAPVAANGVVLALVPIKPASAIVRIEGVSVTTGKVVWSKPGGVLVADAPSACPKPLGKVAFCLTVAVSPTQAILVALQAINGDVLETVPNLSRSLANEPGLYEASGKTPTLDDVALPGGVRWAETVTTLFGPGHDPSFGWNFDRFGSVEVGTVAKIVPGITPQDKVITIPLGGDETVGFSATTGKRMWTLPGFLQCDGVPVPNVPYLCVFTGSAAVRAAGGFTPSRGATVTIEGFDPATGKITWRRRIADLSDVVLGNAAIEDKDHLVVTTTHKRRLVLDLTSGGLSAPKPGEVFWCGHLNRFQVQPTQGIANDNRQGSSFYEPCNAAMTSVSALGQPPQFAGAMVGGIHVWATPTALRGEMVVVPHTKPAVTFKA